MKRARPEFLSSFSFFHPNTIGNTAQHDAAHEHGQVAANPLHDESNRPKERNDEANGKPAFRYARAS